MQPRPLQLRRLVIAEATTFPQLGKIFYDGGPGLTIRNLADAFARLHDRRQPEITDPMRAASDFNWLVMSEPVNRAMLLDTDGPPDNTALDQ